MSQESGVKISEIFTRMCEILIWSHKSLEAWRKTNNLLSYS